jgi:hypothetical protein
MALFFGLSAWAMAWAADPANEATDKAQEWEMAARNREGAAQMQVDEAATQLAVGELMRKAEYLYEADRDRNLTKAGEAESRAGDLYGLACANLEKAAANWDKAAGEFGKAKNEESQRRAQALFRAALEQAAAAASSAAESFEHAADAYSKQNADEPQKAAAASEKAAGWREKRAGTP